MQKYQLVDFLNTYMQIPVNTHGTIRSWLEGLKLLSNNVNWNSCIYYMKAACGSSSLADLASL